MSRPADIEKMSDIDYLLTMIEDEENEDLEGE